MPLPSLLSELASAASSAAASAAATGSAIAATAGPTLSDISDANKAAHVLSWISLVCLVITLFSYVGFRAKRHFPTRLPAYVIACAILYTISMLMGVYHAPCAAQGVVMYYSGFALWIWSTIICANFFFSLDSGAVAADLEGQERTYNAVAWGVPFIFLFFALVFDKVDSRRGAGDFWYCFVATDASATIQGVFFYSWFLVAAIIALFFWPVSLYRLYQAHRPQLGSAFKTLRHVAGGRYMRFMLFFCAFFISLFVLRVLDTLRESDSETLMAHTFITCSAGVWISSVFFFSRSNLARWARFLKRQAARARALCCCCCKGTSDDSSSSSSGGSDGKKRGWWYAGGDDEEEDEAPDDEMFDEIYGVTLYYDTHPDAAAAAATAAGGAGSGSLNSPLRSHRASKGAGKSKGGYAPPANEGAVVLVPEATPSSWGAGAGAGAFGRSGSFAGSAAAAGAGVRTGAGAGAGAGAMGRNDSFGAGANNAGSYGIYGASLGAGIDPASLAALASSAAAAGINFGGVDERPESPMFPGSIPNSLSGQSYLSPAPGGLGGGLVGGSGSSVGRSVLQEVNTKTYFHHYTAEDASVAKPVVEKGGPAARNNNENV